MAGPNVDIREEKLKPVIAALRALKARLPAGSIVDTANSPLVGEFARFTDADTIEGLTAAELQADLGLPINVLAYGADPTNVADSTAAFTAAIAAAAANPGGEAGNTVYVPPGTYWLQGGIAVPYNVVLQGAGMHNTQLQAWYDDVTVVSLTYRGAVKDLTIFAKGGNSDTGTFGASTTTYALEVAADAFDGLVSNVKLHGGYYALFIEGTDTTFFNVIAHIGYGPALIYEGGANWHFRCKFDAGTVGHGGAKTAWASATAYSVDDIRATGGYNIICTQAGTSGGSAPTLKNYDINITDGTCIWRLAAPTVYSGMLFAGDNIGENSFYQVDLSGAYSASLTLNETGPGTARIFIHNTICSAPLYFTASNGQISVSESEINDVIVDTGYAGRFFLYNNPATGGVWNVTVGANVSNFAIQNNYLAGGTITVDAGTSDYYSITGNTRATIVDGGTGTNKSVQNDDAYGATWNGALSPPSKNAVYDQMELRAPKAAPTFTGLVTTAGQIAFPATQAASADANTLDDYEEGTWTPVDTSGASLSLSNVTGYYTKIGRLVTFGGRFDFPVTANGANNITGGLPFTCANNDGARGGYRGYVNVAAAVDWLVTKNSTSGLFSNSTGGQLTNAQLSTAVCVVAGSYMV